jgi:hypothetical protein
VLTDGRLSAYRLSSTDGAEYLNIEEPEPTTAITLQDINMFRVGKYAEAAADTKRKWCHVMLHFLPGVCSKYGKSDIRQATAASAVSTPSDEALVMWFLRFNAQVWETEKNSDDTTQEDNEDGAPATKKRKRKGPHMSQMNLQVFLHMLNDTSAKRMEEDGGKGWDDALMSAAKEEHISASGVKGVAFDDALVGDGRDTEQAKVVMPYKRSSLTPV